VLRVITLEDGETLHNAFPDRNFEADMKVRYYPETDNLYLELSQTASADTRILSEDMRADFDKGGNLIGLDIDNASKHVDLAKLETEGLPAILATAAA
jgi:uncharacterized protein YuzE